MNGREVLMIYAVVGEELIWVISKRTFHFCADASTK